MKRDFEAEYKRSQYRKKRNLKILQQYHAGLTCREIAKLHDLSPMSISKIVRKMTGKQGVDKLTY